MSIITSILNFIKTAFSAKYIAVTLAFIILGLFVWNVRTQRKLNREIVELRQANQQEVNNREAMIDSITNRVDRKFNKAIGEKIGYVVNTVDDIKTYDKALYSELKSMGKTVAGIQSQLTVNLPTIISAVSKPTVDPNDSTKLTIPWDFNYNDPGLTQRLVGRTQFRLLDNKISQPIKSTLDSNMFKIKLTYGFIEKDNKYIVQASSPSKFVTFDELNGALILDKILQPTTIKRQPNWSFGPYIGLGLNTDMKGQNSRFGWSIGVAGTYSLIKL